MYLQSREGLGQWVKRSSAPLVFETSSGDLVFEWMPLFPPDPRAREREILLRNVTFRTSFADFLREVEWAVKRWVKYPSYARKLVAKEKDGLKKYHQKMIDSGIPDKAPVNVFIIFTYRGSNGSSWRIVEIRFTGWNQPV